jgi:protein-S-isoprenylcysteine O-methyltransferase Ste14
MRILELKVPPPAIVFVIAVLMWLVSRVTPAFAVAFPAQNPFASSLAAVGLITGIAGIVAFRKAQTTVNPMKPDSTSSLVMGGVYAVSRNPMYLGGLLILTGWAVLLSNGFAFLCLPAYILYMNRFQIAPDEKALTSLFGQNFVAYKSRVRRWL